MADGRSAFEKPGRFFRGNLHTHSTRSDGHRSPHEVCNHYEAIGHDFICLSDHFLRQFDFPITDTRQYRNEHFTTLLGAEIHADANSHGEMWHMLAVGLPEDFAPTGPDETGVALAARAKAAGAFVGIAHPEWSSLTIEDGRAMASHAHAVEIFNSSCALETGRPGGCYLWDALLNEGHRHLTAYATDDAHFRMNDAGFGWIMVKAAANEPEALLAAMKAGDTYSSTGPELHDIAVEDGRLRVATSPVMSISVLGRGSRSHYVSGAALTEARLPVTSFWGDWCRVVAIAADGTHAWSNPIFPG